MAFTQADRDALASAIASGATSVSYEGKSVTYRSLDEMRQTLAMIDQELSTKKNRRRISPLCTKNL